MIGLLIISGLLIAAAIFAVVWCVGFIVTVIRYKKGKLTKDDLNRATATCKKNRDERKKRRNASYHSMMRHLGYE